MYRYSIKPFLPAVQVPVFHLPSVLDAKSFTQLVKSQTRVLEKLLLDEYRRSQPHLYSQAFEETLREKARLATARLRALKQREVEDIILNKYGLKSEQLVTCLVPYQYAVNIILSRMPNEIRDESVLELKLQERNISEGKKVNTNRWIQWQETDIYTSTGINYLKRISTQLKKRIPIFSIMGHINHGKTSLLDALQRSSIVTDEAGGITQSIRVFTIPHLKSSDLFTFIDTPGHKMFAEMRFHSQVIADFIILVVSITEGVGSQTHEVIKVALNVDKPIIVVINKLDLLSDAATAENKVDQLLAELRVIGIDVDLVHTTRDFDNFCKPYTQQSGVIVTTHSQSGNYFLPMKKVDASYQGSVSKPKVNLRRRCLGVCLSATKKINIQLLWSILRGCKEVGAPVCHSNAANDKQHNCVVQALVVESSKHLFDEEGFRRNRFKQRIQRRVDVKSDRFVKEIEKKGPATRLNMARNSIFSQMTKYNRTSTNVLVLSVIVTEGVITRGMNFVADQSEGNISYMMDYWGNSIKEAFPGMGVTIIDANNSSGLPGVGIHVLSVTDEVERLRIHAYRQVLQWFVECFPLKLHLLRPRGMNVLFAHLGDYGQLRATESLEAQVVYGCINGFSESSSSPLPGEKTVAQYLLEVSNTEESDSVPCVNLLEGKRTNQVLFHESQENALNADWQGLQQTELINSQEEYEKHLRQCIHIGVFLKVDSWHSARMLYREAQRLGTRKIAFGVVGIRYGPLNADDVIFFAQTAKIIICYRTPYALSSELDHFIEITDQYVLHTDHFADIITFLKWCAVAIHREEFPDDPFQSCDSVSPSSLSSSSITTRESSGSETPDRLRRADRSRKLLLTF